MNLASLENMVRRETEGFKVMLVLLDNRALWVHLGSLELLGLLDLRVMLDSLE